MPAGSSAAIPWPLLVETLGGLCAFLLIVVCIVVARLRALRAQLDDTLFQNRSLSTTYGRITEQWWSMIKMPLTEQGFLGL